LRAVGDGPGQEPVGVEVVLADEVTVEIRCGDVLDQIEAVPIRRDGVEREVAVERDRLVAERRRVDNLEGAHRAQRHRER